MSAETKAVDDYLRACTQNNFWPSTPDVKSQLLHKSFAQQLARSATQSIEDRRHRAAVKAEVYNHLVPLLDRHAQTTRDLHRFYQKLLAGLGTGLTLTLLVLAALLIP